VANGVVSSDWSKAVTAPKFSNTLVQTTWQLKADDAISGYSFDITHIEVQTGNNDCVPQSLGALATSNFNKNGQEWLGTLTMKPGETTTWNIVLFCHFVTDRFLDDFHITVTFKHFLPIDIYFQKTYHYGTSLWIGDQQHAGNANQGGYPQKGFDDPGAEFKQYCPGFSQSSDTTKCALDVKGVEKRSFYMQIGKGKTDPVYIMAPKTSSDSHNQFPGVHQSYFFNYNNSAMLHCNPTWDVSQKGLIKNKEDFVQQKQAVVTTDSPPFVLTISYNCSTEYAKCAQAGECATEFTGFVNIKAKGCDPDHQSEVVECTPPIFKWIKTVSPVKPAKPRPTAFGTDETSMNVTWLVPVSGDGADDQGRQLITKYTVTIKDSNHAERAPIVYVLPVDEDHPEFFKKAGETINFHITGLNQTYYHGSVNVTNQARLFNTGEFDGYPVQPNPSSKSGTMSSLSIALIALGSAAAFMALVCLMYHNCIKSKSGKKAERPIQETLLANPSSGTPAPDPYMHQQPDPSYPAAQQRPTDAAGASADDLLSKMMSEA
jgi:hypothetical protein